MIELGLLDLNSNYNDRSGDFCLDTEGTLSRSSL